MSGRQIIEDIRNQTQTQLEEIQHQAESDLNKRREATDRKMAEMVSRADRSIAEEEQRVRLRIERQLGQEERRIRLALQDRVLQSVRRLVEADLSRLRESPVYPSLLVEWTIEAAFGLGYGNPSGAGGPGSPLGEDKMLRGGSRSIGKFHCRNAGTFSLSLRTSDPTGTGQNGSSGRNSRNRTG